MYRPKLFDVNEPEKIINFVKSNSFGILSSWDGKMITATHIPLEVIEDQDKTVTLYGHVSRVNLQWKTLEENEEVLVIFQGPHTYISSKWYEGHNVPTWNYKSAHLYGKATLISGKPLLDHLERMVAKYESSSPHPLLWQEMPEKMILRQIKGIVGFKIVVTRMEAAFKLSQNRNKKDFENIINQLNNRKDSESHAIAHEMEKLKNNLF